MSFFPAQYSTLQAAALQRHIAQRYGLPGLHCRFLLRGVSDTYVLENETPQYILKVYRAVHRSRTEIEGEVELLNALRAGGGQVAAPIADAQGQYLQTFEAAEGTRHGVLFPFAKGRVVIDLDDAQLAVTGREIARIHTIAEGLRLQHGRMPYNNHTTLERPLQILETGMKAHSEEYAWLRDTADRVLRKMESFNTAAFSRGYCHYDFLPKNFHFDEQNNVTFFDFDFAGEGFLANDLMTVLVHFFFHAFQFKRITPEKAEADFQKVIDAYRQVKPLSEEEVAALPYLGYMFWVFYFGFYFEHFDDWSNTFLGPNFIRTRTALIKDWVAQYCRF